MSLTLEAVSAVLSLVTRIIEKLVEQDPTKQSVCLQFGMAILLLLTAANHMKCANFFSDEKRIVQM